jgi:ABC-type transporter Mla subunit MlaD
MSDEEKFDKHCDGSPEKTLITLEQLSQTIEVMTSVVNRLRQHLNEQLEKQNLTKQEEFSTDSDGVDNASEAQPELQKERRAKTVVEISQQDNASPAKTEKVIH